MLYEALIVIAGPFFKFTIVKMKGPNKPLNHKKIKVFMKRKIDKVLKRILTDISINQKQRAESWLLAWGI